MQEFIHLYNDNRAGIERFLTETIRINGQLLSPQAERISRFFGLMPSLELIYITDHAFIQTSHNISRDKTDASVLGKNRQYLVSKMDHSEENASISTPYVSTATGEACVTVMVQWENHYYFFDFNLTRLLTVFGLLEQHPLFNQVTKVVYLLIGVSLVFFALASIGYAFFSYGQQLMTDQGYSLESVFEPIVALTLGLAIFDLAKTLLEREVFFKAYADKKDESRLLSKFLTAIVIALSIEALMVVFKSALHDVSQMLYALYLIIGVALIIGSMALYHKWVITSSEDAASKKFIAGEQE